MEMKNNTISNDYYLDIKEFVWRLLEQWKAIVLLAICVSALFLGLLHVHYSNNAAMEKQVQESKQKISAEEIVDALPESERTAVTTAYRLWQEREQLSDYIQTAQIMKIDPSHANRLRASWAIDGLSNDTNTLAMSYVVAMQSDDSVNVLRKASGIDIQDDSFNELLYITYPDKIEQEVVCVDLFLTEEMEAEDVQYELQQLLNSIHNQLSLEFGEHQIKNYKSEIAFVSDERLYDKQTKVFNNYNNFNNQITNLNNSFTSGQKGAFVKLKEKDIEPEKEEQIRTAPKAVSLSNILIGLVLGGLVYVGLFLAYTVLSKRVNSTEILTGSSVRFLGEWYDSSTTNNLLMKDGFIWKRHHQKHLDEEAEIKKISNTIKSICHFREIDNVLLTITGKKTKNQEEFIERIINNIKASSINIKCLETNGSLDDSAFIDANGIVLVIIDSKTRIEDLHSVFECCNNYERPIVGSVYLG